MNYAYQNLRNVKAGGNVALNPGEMYIEWDQTFMFYSIESVDEVEKIVVWWLNVDDTEDILRSEICVDYREPTQ